MSNQLQQVQEDMYNRLLAEPYFANVGLFLARPRAAGSLALVQTEVDRHLAGIVSRGGAKGIVAIVTIPTADSQDPNIPGPRLTFHFAVRVIERPMQNMGDGGSGKPAEEVALAVLQLFHHFKPNPAFTLVAANQALIPVTEGDDRVAYDCRFDQITGLPRPAKVATPVIVVDTGTATISCATGGAAIVYSLDGSYPSLAYSTPVAVGSASIVRAAATLANYQQSDVAELDLT